MAMTDEEKAALYGGIDDFETRADTIKREELTGSPRTPLQTGMEVVTNPVENILKPFSGGSMDFLSGANTGLVGAAQLATEAATLPALGLDWLMGDEYGMDSEERREFIDENLTNPEIARQKAYARYREDLTGKEPSGFMKVVGEIFPAMFASPTTAAPTVLGRLGQSFKFGGLAGGMEFEEGGSLEVASNMLLGATLGIVFQGGIDSAVGLKRLVEKAKLQKLNVNNPTAQDVLSREETTQVLDAAERLGITVTPAEATGDLMLVHGQNQIMINEATRGELAEFILKRNDDLTENILALQRVGDRDLQYAGATFTPANAAAGDTVAARPPFLGAQDEVRWKKSRQEVFRKALEPKELSDIVNSSPLLRRQLEKYNSALKKEPSKRTDADVLALESINSLKRSIGIKGDISINNVGFLDMVINNLDQVLDKGADVSTAAGRQQIKDIQNQRKALSEALKRRVTGYGDVKAQGQRARAVSMLRDVVDTSSRKGEYAENFYKGILKDKTKREELIKILKPNDPNAANTVADLGLVMQHIFSDANLARKLNQGVQDIATESTGSAGQFGPLAVTVMKLKSLLKKDEAMIRVLTDPRWAAGIKNIKARTPDETLVKLTSFLTTVTNTSDKIENTLTRRAQREAEEANRPRQTSKQRETPTPSRMPLGIAGRGMGMITK